MAASAGLTALEAVNRILETVGEFPVTTLPAEVSPADTTSLAARAETHLYRETKTVLTRGWPENTQKSARKASGSTISMAGIYAVRGAGRDSRRNFAILGNELWDADAGSTTIETILASDAFVHLDLIHQLSGTDKDNFEMAAAATKEVIASYASQTFQRRIQGSAQQDAFLMQEQSIAEAYADRNPMEADTQLPNVQPMLPQQWGNTGQKPEGE